MHVRVERLTRFPLSLSLARALLLVRFLVADFVPLPAIGPGCCFGCWTLDACTRARRAARTRQRVDARRTDGALQVRLLDAGGEKPEAAAASRARDFREEIEAGSHGGSSRCFVSVPFVYVSGETPWLWFSGVCPWAASSLFFFLFFLLVRCFKALTGAPSFVRRV